ncbi:MAG: DegV family protein [Candidatus Heimdallarchaeota archaeon]
MKKVKIITDSTCDLTVEELKELDVDFVPAYVIIDGKKFKQHINITNDEVYRQLIDEKRTIGTAASAPGEFLEVFEKALEEAESIIFISVISKLSAVNQTATLVANKYLPNKDITIIDSQAASLAHAILVIEASKMVKEGKTKDEIVDRITYLADYTVALPLLDTLEYIYRGGRIKLYQKLLGNFLGIKPLVRIDKGGSTIDGKVKGRKNALIQLKMCGLQIQDHLKVNIMYVAYTTNRAIAEEVAHFLKENGRKDVDVRIGQLGSVVGVHGGNDVTGFGFVGHYEPSMFNELGKVSLDVALAKWKSKIKG